MRNKNKAIEHQITHIERSMYGESLQLKTPNYMYHIMDENHVVLHNTILLTSTQYCLQKLHTKLAQFEPITGSKLLLQSACLYCAIQSVNVAEPSSNSPCLNSAIITGTLIPLIVQISCTTYVQLLSISPFHLPLPLVFTELSMH